MSDDLRTCKWETRVTEAANGLTMPEVARHAASCESCSELLATIEFLQQAAPNVDIPAAGHVFWKAELRVRRENAERALRPLRWIETGAVAVLASVAIAAGVLSNAVPITAAEVGFCAAALGCVLALARSKPARSQH